MPTLHQLSEALTVTGTQHRLVIAGASTKTTKPKRKIKLLTIQEHNPLYVKVIAELKKAGLHNSGVMVSFHAPTYKPCSEFATWPDMVRLTICADQCVYSLMLRIAGSGSDYEHEISARYLGDGPNAHPWVSAGRKLVPGSRYRYAAFEEVMARNWKAWLKQAKALLKNSNGKG